MLKISTKILFLGILLSLFFTWNGKVSADTPDWISSNDYSFKQVQTNVVLPDTVKPSFRNLDCENNRITTAAPETFALFFKLGSTNTENVCGFYNNYGFIGNNYLSEGNNLAGEIFNKTGRRLIGSNNSPAMLSYSTAQSVVAGAGALYYTKTISAQKQIYTSGTLPKQFKARYLIDEFNGVSMNYQGNNRVIAMIGTINFSPNGRWAVMDTNGTGYLRVDMSTGEMLFFGYSFNYGMGNDPNYSTAISPSGRYAVVAGGSASTIYDLQNCAAVPGTHIKKCAEKQLETFVNTKTGFISGLNAYVRFKDDNRIYFQAGGRINGQLQRHAYMMGLGSLDDVHKIDYLGMGDSFASGEGAFNYQAVTDTKGNKCHLSSRSYPFLLASHGMLDNAHSVACSGAVMDDLFKQNAKDLDEYVGQAKDGKNQKQRFDSGEAYEIMQSYLPGKITQFSFVEELRPKRITISIGGNDVGFSDKLSSCLIGSIVSTCFNSYKERKEVLVEIASQIPRLESVYNQLKKDDRQVYVIGYPKIIKTAGNCAGNVHFNASEADYANSLAEQLNNTIKIAAKRSGVFYVDVEDVFDGHKLCETNSDDAYVNGLTAGGEMMAVFGAESFHPKASGHAAYKERILSATNNLTSPMPAPVPNIEFSEPPINDKYWGLLAPDNSTISQLRKDDFVVDRINAGEQERVLIDGIKGLAPNSPLRFEIHSDPISIPGTYYTDASGNIDQTITIPVSVEPGYHSIHILAKDEMGRDVDIYDYVLIGKSDTDFDGDGVLDKDEGCVFMAPIGHDSDKDGVDDACDGFADPLPDNPPVIPVTTDPKDNMQPTYSDPQASMVLSATQQSSNLPNNTLNLINNLTLAVATSTARISTSWQNLASSDSTNSDNHVLSSSAGTLSTSVINPADEYEKQINDITKQAEQNHNPKYRKILAIIGGCFLLLAVAITIYRRLS